MLYVRMIVTYFAVGNVAEHSGGIVTMRGPAWPAEGGWTEQDVTGAHGTILCESTDRAECERVLAEWERCSSAEEGRYCYTHNHGAN